ncbi:MAG TPA: penicillin-binding protein 2 [Thermoanaerobaculia bacterium]|nr:penicillin-binding protein 2 [Thermoanaerobaculia bacterium]
MIAREYRDELRARAERLMVLLSLALVGLAIAFWSVQIMHGERYRELAENNRLRRVPIEAPRGLVTDRHGRVLVENVPSYNLLVDGSQVKNLEETVRFAAQVLSWPASELAPAAQRIKKGADYRPVLIAENLSLAQVSRFGVAGAQHPEFEIEVGHQRIYRQGSVTAHVLGYLGEVNASDLATRPELYEPGDLVGRKGIEARYDPVLRGRDGERLVVVDSRGRRLEEASRKPAEPGSAMKLTLDLDLQQEAARLLADHVGAVVALDPRNGEILALVSSPSYDPNVFARRLALEDWQKLIEAPHHPLHNRALQSTYSPGSLFKIVMGVAGLAEGFVSPSDTVTCTGATEFYGRRFRCWKRGGHGTVNLHEAIKYSCDTYFYRLGQRMGVDRIAKASRLFGLGGPSGIDLAGEKNGLVPDSDWSLRARGHPWYAGETISVSIGQGPVLTTPLQMATLLAAVANGGTRVTPHLVLGAEAPAKPLGVHREALAAVRRGLWAVVNEGDGTARGARLPHVEIAGKTGTVQVVSQATWTDSDTLPFEQRDHAWFASFAPFDDPTLVIVVFFEHGGKGSQAAAPVAKALYEHFFPADSTAVAHLGG